MIAIKYIKPPTTLPSKTPMLINLLTESLLFPVLDPRHLGRLCLVNREFAACIDKDIRDKSVAAARAKYGHMVILSDGTVRIHSSLGRTVVDLTLPTLTGKINHSLAMRFEGRLYRGGEESKLSPGVFHAKSPRLLEAKSVFLARRPVMVEGHGMFICVVVEQTSGEGRTFILRFDQ